MYPWQKHIKEAFILKGKTKDMICGTESYVKVFYLFVGTQNIMCIFYVMSNPVWKQRMTIAFLSPFKRMTNSTNRPSGTLPLQHEFSPLYNMLLSLMNRGYSHLLKPRVVIPMPNPEHETIKTQNFYHKQTLCWLQTFVTRYKPLEGFVRLKFELSPPPT